MNIDNWDEVWRVKLLAEAEELAKLGPEELSLRIAAALDMQDSCPHCELETVRQTLLTGKCMLWTCAKCTEEMGKMLAQTETQKEIERLLTEFFKGDIAKVDAWMKTPNPLFGEKIPFDLIHEGREDKLLKMVKDILEGIGP